MADGEIRVSPENQRQAAANHKAVGEDLGGAASIFDESGAWGQGLGPVFKEWTADLNAVIEERRGFYSEEAEEQDNLGSGLNKAADMWDENEAQAARDIGSVEQP